MAELSSRAKLDRDALLKLIEEKKAKVGAGYLTDQGALFLVASDLGVSVDYDRQKPASLASLEPDLKSVTVIGRILSLAISQDLQPEGRFFEGPPLKTVPLRFHCYRRGQSVGWGFLEDFRALTRTRAGSPSENNGRVYTPWTRRSSGAQRRRERDLHENGRR